MILEQAQHIIDCFRLSRIGKKGSFQHLLPIILALVGFVILITFVVLLRDKGSETSGGIGALLQKISGK
ncbi:MAG: hypothetical protein ACQESC_01825 [Nanobdellota archaeon]